MDIIDESIIDESIISMGRLMRKEGGAGSRGGPVLPSKMHMGPNLYTGPNFAQQCG